MKTGLIDTIIGFVAAGLGVIGLFMASGAVDSAISLFGTSLFVAAVLFDFHLIKGHFDRLDAVEHG